MSENSAPFNIREIAPDKTRADDVCKELDYSVKLVKEELGTELAGYAVVGWTMGGRCTSGYIAQVGLVCRGLVPSLVHDALQRHITIDMVNEGTAAVGRPDDPA